MLILHINKRVLSSLGLLKKIDLRCQIKITFDLSKSIAFISEPWKYLTRVCCRFSKPSNSKSGSALKVRKNLDSYSGYGKCITAIRCCYQIVFGRHLFF